MSRNKRKKKAPPRSRQTSLKLKLPAGQQINLTEPPSEILALWEEVAAGGSLTPENIQQLNAWLAEQPEGYLEYVMSLIDTTSQLMLAHLTHRR